MSHCALMPLPPPASGCRGCSRPLAFPDRHPALLHHGCNPSPILVADCALQDRPWQRLALPAAWRCYLWLGKGAEPLPPEIHRKDRQALRPTKLARV